MYQVKIKEGRVIKHFRSFWAFKWAIAIPFLPVYPFALTPTERFQRELSFMTKWSGKRAKVPKIYYFDSEKLIIEREMVEGTTLDRMKRRGVEELFRLIGDVHSTGWALGDTKPTNFIFNEEEEALYIIDGEQALPDAKVEWRIWDFVLSSLFSVIMVPPSYIRRNLMELAKIYVESGGDEEVKNWVKRRAEFLKLDRKWPWDFRNFKGRKSSKIFKDS